MTLDQATEYAEKFMGDYAKVLLESTLFVERDEPTDQHAFNVAERKEEQMARDLAEALATVGGYGITFAPTLDRPPETMVGETVYDSEGNAIGWIANATVGVGTCRRERFDADPDGIFVGEIVIDDEGNEMPIAGIFGYRCSECKGLLQLEWVACPHCGKRIIEEEK